MDVIITLQVLTLIAILYGDLIREIIYIACWPFRAIVRLLASFVRYTKHLLTDFFNWFW